MMEVMVATLVLSAGLLGLAAMQTRAIQTASGLATQQVMSQVLGAYGEAQLADPNYALVYDKGVGGTSSNNCRGVWMDLSPAPPNPPGSYVAFDPTAPDINPDIPDYFNTFLGTYTPCGSKALNVYIDYRNSAATPDPASNQNARECDYIAPQTRTLTCTLMTGESIRLENLVWIR